MNPTKLEMQYNRTFYEQLRLEHCPNKRHVARRPQLHLVVRQLAPTMRYVPGRLRGGLQTAMLLKRMTALSLLALQLHVVV